MNCPRCGKSIPGVATFCTQCGHQLSKPKPAAPVPSAAVAGGTGGAVMAGGLGQAYAAQRKKNAVIAALAVVATLVGGILVGARFGGLRLGAAKPDGSNLRAGAALPPPSLERMASSGPPVLQKGAERVEMPKDVEDWLKHLAETERRKRLLTSRQTTDLMSMKSMADLGVHSVADVNDITDPDKVMDKTPDQNALNSMIGDLKPAWYRLDEFFRSVPPPAECQTIASNYSTGLNQIGDTMGDIGNIVDSVNPMAADLNSDVAAKKKDLYQIQQSHRETIDQAFKKALYGVDEVCHKYNRERWFDIDTSGGGSNILGSYVGSGQ